MSVRPCQLQTFRVEITATPAQRARAYDLLEAGGDVWAWCIDRYHARRRAKEPQANSNIELWPELRVHGPFGDLSMTCAQDVAKNWSAVYFEAKRRQKAGECATLPLRKRRLVPVTCRKGKFILTPSTGDARARVRLETARSAPTLDLRLSHDHPYDEDLVRSVRLHGKPETSSSTSPRGSVCQRHRSLR